MLKFSSWLIRNAWRATGASSFGRFVAASLGILMAAGASAQTPPPLPTIQLTATAYSVNEDNGRIVVAARRFGNTNIASTVRITAVGASAPLLGAVDGQDFIARTTVLNFPTNATEAFFDVIILDNDRTNETRYINLSLSNPSGATLGSPSSANVQIVDDETGLAGFATGAFEFSAEYYTVTDYEGVVRSANAASYPGANITVVRKGGTRGRVQVDVATGGGTAFPELYFPINTTLTFDDYEMSKSFIVPIFQYLNFNFDLFDNWCYATNDTGGATNFCDPTLPPPTRVFPGIPIQIAVDDTCYYWNFYQQVSPFFLFGLSSLTFDVNLILSNPRLDPAEDHESLPDPTLGALTTAHLGIVVIDALKNENGRPIPQFFGHSFERAQYRTIEGGAGSPTGRGISFYQMWVNRDFCVDEALVRYEVNNDGSAAPEGNHLLRGYRLEAGSDYAHPFADYLPPGSAAWHVATESDGSEQDAIIRWGRNEAGPKPATVPIISDDRVEFDEDMLVQLYHRVGDPGLIASPAAREFGYNGYPRNTKLTIEFDNIRYINNDDIFHVAYDTNGVFGAEQPAGAGDRRFNRHGESDIDPPFNALPGANASVLAVDVGLDGKLYLGGEFIAVNSKDFPWVNHFARTTRDGQVDTNFVIGTGPNQAVTAIELQPDGKAIIGGLFSAYNGQLRNGLARVNVDGSLDASFNPGLGANAPVRAVKLLPDGKVLVGGEFTSFNGTNVNFLARLNSNGSLDTSFNPGGAGPDGFVYSIATTGDPMIVELRSLDAGQRRERSDTYDTGSNQGTFILDYDFANTVDNIKVYYNGVVIADTQNAVGSGTISAGYGPGPLNTTLLSVVVNEADPGLFGNAASWSYRMTILPQLDGLPVIGGLFNSYNGVARSRVARLSTEGQLDTSFNIGLGVQNGVVYSVAKHGNKPVVGGVFSTVNQFGRNNIVQFNQDGSVDTFFNPGEGFNDIVFSLVVQPTGKLVCGGLFTEFNRSRRIAMARLNHDGKLDTSFMDTAYNQFAGLPNDYTWKAENSVNAMVNLRLTNTYTASMVVTNQDNTTNIVERTFTRIEDQLFVGGSFTNIGGGYTRNDTLPRGNFARVWGGTTPGPGTVGFLFDDYTVDENAGSVFIIVNRDHGHLSPATAPVFTADIPQGTGAATALQDYLPVTTSVIWPTARTVANFSRQLTESYRGPNSREFFVTDQQTGGGLPGTNDIAPLITRPLYIPILDDSAQEGSEQLQLNLTTGQTLAILGGEPIPTWPALGRDTARLKIVDNDFSPGVISFEKANYFVDENVRKARISLIRTNGSAGAAKVDVRTFSQGFSATPGPGANADFNQINVLTVNFAAGQTNAFFDVDIIDDVIAEFDETVSLRISNPGPIGVGIGRSSAVLTIVDNDFAAGRVQFLAATNSVDEGAGFVSLVISRTGGNIGTSQVQLSTADLTARAGIDYVATNVTLRWASLDSADKIVNIPILDRNAIEGTNLTFQVLLTNPTVNGQPEPNALGNQRSIVVEILNNDNFGNLRFSQTAYVVDENGTNALITVVRVNGTSGDLSVDYQARPASAVAGQDFAPVSGTLVFTNNQSAASFVIPITDDTIVDGTKTVELTLSNQLNSQDGVVSPGALTFPFENVMLSIIDNELENIPAGSLDVTFLADGANDFIYTLALQTDGRLLLGGDFTSVNSVLRSRLARLNTDGTVDPTFFASAAPDASVRALAIQSDGRILIAGNFQRVGDTTRNYIARLNVDGGIDSTFDPGAGANNPVYSMIVQSNGKILIGGDFSAYGPTPRNGVARLNENGTLDTTFNPGTGASGTGRFTVFAIAQQLDGKILLGGDFETFNNVPARRIVRLNLDGSVDTSFNMSVGANGSVRSIAVQPDGRILVGGLFTSVQGAAANRIARLNRDGTLDTSFNPTILSDPARRGANGPVLAIAVQNDNKIVLGGDFTEYNGVTRRGLTRLNIDGSNDATINFGTGADGSVAAVVVQPDRRIVLAGGFTEYDGQPRLRIARIHGGSIAGSGRFEFVRSSYVATETGTNVVITVRRTGGGSGAVTMNYATEVDPSVPSDSSATPGFDYASVSGSLFFPEGETQASFKVQIFNDTLVENEEVFNVALSDQPGQPFRLGDQPTARVVIVSDDSEIFFTVPSFSVGESIPSASAAVTITRVGSVSVPASVDFRTSDGTATAGADYTAFDNTITFAVGESQRTVSIGIISDALVEGNESVNLTLSNPSAGSILRPGGSTGVLTIVDDDTAPGEIRLQRPTYSVREGNLLAQVAVVRTNGLFGAVTVRYQTTAGTATPGQDYNDKSGIITFNDGESLKFIEVQIIDDESVENNETINIRLSEPGGQATLGLDAAVLTIVDDDLGAGSLDTGFDPGVGANGPIRAIEFDGRGHYVIGGDFTAYNNDARRSRIARIHINGQIDQSFSTNNRPNNGVWSLALQPDDGRIVMGGAFNTVNGQIENRVARLLAEGGLDTSFLVSLGLDAPVTDLAIQPDRKVIIGGWFRLADAAAYRRIARLHPNGTVDVSFDPGTGADGNVNTVALQSDGRILIGGAFNTVDGIGAGRIARLNPDGSIDISFRTGSGFTRADGKAPVVYDILLLDNGRILVVGDFTAYNGTARAGVAMLDQNGILQSFASGLQSVNGAIRTVALQRTDRNNKDEFIIGGDFTAVDGTPRARLARLDAVGRFDTTFDPGDGANDSVLDIYVQPQDGRVVVVGAFTEFNNNTNLRGIARLNNDKAFLPPAAPMLIGPVTQTATGALRITFNGDQGETYVIEGTNDFVSWTSERTVAGAGPGTTTEIPTSTPYRFFRVRRQ